MSSLKLAKDDPSTSSTSNQSVAGKALLPQKRLRLESTSEEGDEEEEEEEEAEEEEEEEEEGGEEDNITEEEVKKVPQKKQIQKKAGSKKSSPAKRTKKGDNNLGPPVYEDFAPDTTDFTSAVERIIQSYIVKKS
jgi:hypothetical protein